MKIVILYYVTVPNYRNQLIELNYKTFMFSFLQSVDFILK